MTKTPPLDYVYLMKTKTPPLDYVYLMKTKTPPLEYRWIESEYFTTTFEFCFQFFLFGTVRILIMISCLVLNVAR